MTIQGEAPGRLERLSDRIHPYGPRVSDLWNLRAVVGVLS
jgi:hypothetical protein